MSLFREVYQADLKRFGNKKVDPYMRKWLYFFRRCQNSTGGNRLLWHRILLTYSERHAIEVDYPVEIGPGLYIGHPYGITINDKVKIGRNCNIHKGVTIGQENRGERKGVPTIGNNVWIGVQATVVGNITIGDDVLIAPNTYLNRDVPSHSIAIGNPARIISREHATAGYIVNAIGVNEND